MSKTKQQPYSVEFKESAVKLANESKVSKAQVARELGINESTLYTWIDKCSKVNNVTRIKDDKHIYDEVKILKQELARVKIEHDILKKAAAYFAKESR